MDYVLWKEHEAIHKLDKDKFHDCLMSRGKCGQNTTINQFMCNKDSTEQSNPLPAKQSDPNIGMYSFVLVLLLSLVC